MKMQMKARIQKVSDGWEIVAEWDKNIHIKCEEYGDAVKQFSQILQEKGVQPEVVTYKMGI